jgi:hypothetical protein
MSTSEARRAAELLGEMLGYVPLSRAPEDGFGIVLIAASGRAKLKQGAAITTKELHTLATLSRPRRAPIKGDAHGEVSPSDALQYLSERGIEL